MPSTSPWLPAPWVITTAPALVACLRCCTAMVPLLLMARKHLGCKIDREDLVAS